MSKTNSGRERVARDAYNTPAWVTDVLTAQICGHTLARGATVWEPAAGKGQMVDRLDAAGFNVIASDIAPSSENMLQGDFLSCYADGDSPPSSRPPSAEQCAPGYGQPLIPFAFDAIITNPPYKIAEKFVRRALDLTRDARGTVAMLLSVDWDSAKTRRDLFAEHPAWGTKIVLLDRIWWFDPPPPVKGEKKAAGPSENHAWFVWDWQGRDGRTMRYAQMPDEARAELRKKMGSRAQATGSRGRKP